MRGVHPPVVALPDAILELAVTVMAIGTLAIVVLRRLP